MGRDNLFHRKKERAQTDRRKAAFREPYPKVLIVCEGTKSELNYFNEIRDHYELATTNIKVSADCGSAPINVVDHAIELYRAEVKKNKSPFDKVYCVFDRDKHTTFDEAVCKAQSQRPAGIFHAVTSTPCFEYWFLLHFGYIQRSFNGTGRLSPADEAEAYLRRNYWPEYKKNNPGHFLHLFDKLPAAKKAAISILSNSITSGSQNPLTNVHELVDFLQKIKDPTPKQ